MRVISATVLDNLERYGIHMLDALAGLGLGPFERVTRLACAHESYAMPLAGGALVMLNCLGAVGRTFHLSFFGTTAHAHVDLHDNFAAFRRTLAVFVGMLSTGRPPIEPRQVLDTMRLIAGAQRLAPGETLDLRPA